MNEIKYIRCNNLIKISLDDLYDGVNNSYNKLKENIKNIIIAEAPLTLNTLKSRLREAFNVAKISQKALEFINEILDSLHVIKTNNCNYKNSYHRYITNSKFITPPSFLVFFNYICIILVFICHYNSP